MATSVLLACGGCADLLALTASLGGSVAGGQGNVRLLFINNTPYRAVFTAGTYDPADESSVPAFVQFGFGETGAELPGDSTSPIGTLRCGRRFSIGGATLLAFIDANASDAVLLPEATIEGIEFFDDGAEGMSVGAIPAFVATLGADFSCGALLIIRYEINDVGEQPFRVDFELVPSESPR